MFDSADRNRAELSHYDWLSSMGESHSPVGTPGSLLLGGPSGSSGSWGFGGLADRRPEALVGQWIVRTLALIVLEADHAEARRSDLRHRYGHVQRIRPVIVCAHRELAQLFE